MSELLSPVKNLVSKKLVDKQSSITDFNQAKNNRNNNNLIPTITQPEIKSLWRDVPLGQPYERTIHLLYVPTMFCNLDCSYCYLGEQTSTANLKKDSLSAVKTLNHALNQLEREGILAFNVSLHGGEVTTLSPKILQQLFAMIEQYYTKHFDAMTARGFKKTTPHIKTNLYKFNHLYDLLNRYKVSISASIDLPLRLHDEHRVLKSGASWRKRTEDNLRLLAKYPHKTKISATLSQEHLDHTDEIIADIWYIHQEIGFDMSNFNLMFAFESELNESCQTKVSLTPASQSQHIELYKRLYAEFVDTELEIGLRRNWFDEFSPSYCTNSINCGEKFYLLQSDGDVYSCVRGQGVKEFHYGNVYESPMSDIIATGASKVSLIHQQHGMDDSCTSCSHLSLCHTGCPVVKLQQNKAKSYTCQLQKHWYADNPLTFQALDEVKRPHYLNYYQKIVHPTKVFNKASNKILNSDNFSQNNGSNNAPIHMGTSKKVHSLNELFGITENNAKHNTQSNAQNNIKNNAKNNTENNAKDNANNDVDNTSKKPFTKKSKADSIVNVYLPKPKLKLDNIDQPKVHEPKAMFQLPSDISDGKNALPQLIASDPILSQMYRDDAFILQLNDEFIPLSSQILKSSRQWFTVSDTDKIIIHVDSQLFDVNTNDKSKERLRNTLYLQLLTDKQVVYGDEERTKQAHLFTHQLWVDFMDESPLSKFGKYSYLMTDITDLIKLYQAHYKQDERINLFFTTLFLREYHYQKHKQNGFYHIQAMNLPFQNFEFYYFKG